MKKQTDTATRLEETGGRKNEIRGNSSRGDVHAELNIISSNCFFLVFSGPVRGSVQNVRSEFARLLIDVKRRRCGRPREPMELARGILPFLSDGKTRRGGAGLGVWGLSQWELE